MKRIKYLLSRTISMGPNSFEGAKIEVGMETSVDEGTTEQEAYEHIKDFVDKAVEEEEHYWRIQK